MSRTIEHDQSRHKATLLILTDERKPRTFPLSLEEFERVNKNTQAGPTGNHDYACFTPRDGIALGGTVMIETI
jgi:hypothetical protein